MSSTGERKHIEAWIERELRRVTEEGDDFDLAVANRLKLHVTDFRCLSLLASTGPLTAGQLAEQTGLTPGAVTGVLDRLEKAGFAARTRDEQDRRQVFIQANTDREPELEELIGPFHQALAEFSGGYDDAQLTRIAEFLNKTTSLYREHSARLRAAPPAVAAAAPPVQGRTGRTEAGLRFSAGASRIELRAAGGLSDLYRADFQGRKPTVKMEGQTVVIQYGLFSPFDWGRSSAQVELNTSVRWALEFKGGVSRLDADLKEARLDALEFSGGASHVTVMLPRPEGQVRIRISGGASHVTLLRPRTHPARLDLRGGASKLRFDEQQFGSIGGKTSAATRDYADTRDRFDIEVSGGASDLTIGAW